MNPENNNSFSNSGAGASSTPAGMPPLDLTSPSFGGSSNGLSMADSMASAQDNLTAAGLASPTTSNVMGLDQISASDPSAMMTPPTEEPLVPAAPVPGSIGSVTSVPPVPDSSAMPMGAATSTAAMPSATAASQAPNAASSMFTPVTPAAANPTAAGATPEANSAPSTAPFNPFANSASTSAGAPTSGTPASDKTVPSNGAFQPAAVQKKVSLKDKLGGGKFNNPVTLIMGGIIALLTVALIIFIVLYIGAVNNKEYVYVPSPNPTPTARTEVLTCNRQIAGEEVGKAGAVWGDTEIVATYNNDLLETITSVNHITFDSPDTAGIARGEYEASLLERAASNGANLDGEVLVDGAVVTMNVRANADTAGMILSGQVVETTNEEGEVVTGLQVNTDLNSVENEFVNQGFACNVAEQ